MYSLYHSFLEHDFDARSIERYIAERDGGARSERKVSTFIEDDGKRREHESVNDERVSIMKEEAEGRDRCEVGVRH